ncbi:protein STAY-GREEN 1, chloroplastic-like [Salvia splendens]|uniref:protein STAY-GREEN 1, chloroplastic-like n=1 Tax=Salvia splendens TaxID=180675 RepID=UPI001C27B4E4|nr:protein STAY-GREEN 1, chloroplastic-like [Salvia splendens]
MVTLETSLLPSKLRLSNCPSSLLITRKDKKKELVARLVGPAIFEASKLKVVYLGVNNNQEKMEHQKLPRTYTLTHCDIISKLTLAISQTINTSQVQGWYNKLQRDEVVGVWKKIKGKMSLHVHCHISGGHFLLDFFCEAQILYLLQRTPCG